MKKTILLLLLVFIANSFPCYAEQEAITFIGEKKYYHVINDKTFEGYAYYNETDKEVVFWVMNKGKWFYDLKDTMYGVAINRGKRTETYGLVFKKSVNLAYNIESLILNPSSFDGTSGDGILIYCYPPFGILPSDNVKGYFITSGRRKIRFGYEVLTWEQKIWRCVPQEWRDGLNKLWTGMR